MINSIARKVGMVCTIAIMAGCSSNATQEEVSNTANLNASSNNKSSQATQATLDTVLYFEFNQSILREESRATLTAHAKDLQKAPHAVRLEGHADERGSREFNMALGESRAIAVRDFLVLQGVDSSLLETISYGEEQPAKFSKDESSWRENRRVEIK